VGLKFRVSSTRARRDIGLMIIELGKYNSAKELLIESNSAGSLGPVNYRSESREVSVTTAAVRMEEKRTGVQT